MSTVSRLAIVLVCVAIAQVAVAKLPPPSEEAKAKAAEAGAKTAWSNNVAAFQLCQVQDRVVASYRTRQSKSGAPSALPVASVPCTDPGPYVAAAPVAASLEKAGAHSAPASNAPPASAASAPAAKS